MDVKIRKLVSSDYLAVKTIEKKMLEEYRREFPQDEALPFISPRYFTHYVSRDGSFVAEADGMIVGFLLAEAAPFMHGEEKTVWMDQIAVLGGFRRAGVGSRLLAAVEDWARGKKTKLMHTTLNTDNEASKRLLMSRGFDVREWRKATKNLTQ